MKSIPKPSIAFDYKFDKIGKSVQFELKNKANNVPVNLSTPKRYWSFSFRYLNQIEYFGLSQSQPNFYIALLEQLKSLGNIELTDFESDKRLQTTCRYHPIDWNARNIPVKIDDFNWLPEQYKNQTEFPFFQIDISKALGRIVGFFDELLQFNVVVLDPLHNFQPCKKNDYKVRKCEQIDTQYTKLLCHLNKLKEKVSRTCNSSAECQFKKELHKTFSETPDNIYAVSVDLQKDIADICVMKNKNIEDIINAGIDSVLSRTDLN